MLKQGDKAPGFELKDQENNLIKLSDFQGEKILIYFYPKAMTPGCTTQSCEVRDAQQDFSKLGVKSFGISPDEPDKQAKFDEKYDLGFPLLSDPDHKTADSYFVWGEKKMYGKSYMGIIRSAFLISEDGIILHAWYKVSPKDTVPNVLKALK